MSRETSSTATKSPNFLVTFLILMNGVALGSFQIGNVWAPGTSISYSPLASVVRRTRIGATRLSFMLLTRLDCRPGTGQASVELWRVRCSAIELGEHLVRWIDARVVANLLVDERSRCLVGVLVEHAVGDRRSRFRTQYVVDKFEGRFRVWRISRDGHHVEAHLCALTRDGINNIDALTGLRCTLLCLQDVARIAEHKADVAVGKIVDVLRRIEVANGRT